MHAALAQRQARTLLDDRRTTIDTYLEMLSGGAPWGGVKPRVLLTGPDAVERLAA